MGYFSTWTERAEAGARLIAPYSLMLILFVLGTISFSFPLGESIHAPLFLMAIYYWAIFRPTLIPPWFVFAAGLMVDLINGIETVGISALIFVVVQWIVSDQRRYLMGQSFLMIWIGFVIVSSAAMFMNWLIFGILTGGWLPLKPIAFSIIFGVALFPLISILLHATHKILPEPPRNLMLKTKRR